MKRTKRIGTGLSATALMVLGAVGCLSRPVNQQEPTTKVNFTTNLSQRAVDKIDLLLMIDNSSSMGDKQAILAEAVPVLLQRLIQPNCVTPEGEVRGASDPKGTAEGNYNCPDGTKPEFKPIVDIHIGLISSSLGDFGAETYLVDVGGGQTRSAAVCPSADSTGPTRRNDLGRLLNVSTDGSVAEASPSNFLAWFPKDAEANAPKVESGEVPANPTENTAALEAAFKKLVVGVGQNGCGLEAQLESIYRFLVQPDPWERVVVNNGRAAYEGIDATLLRQRADFLRPDSLVAVVALTDEDDSSSDPLAISGFGWGFMSQVFPGSSVVRQQGFGTTAPKPTQACAQNPTDPQCSSCGFDEFKGDPGCQPAAYYPDEDESLNVRFHLMKKRFGVDPQYPLKRYFDGFTNERIPDRAGEHDANGAYTGVPTCVNPLFAGELPKADGADLCNLPLGTRTKEQIFFAIVGGAPQDLLHFKEGDAEASKLSEGDWRKLVGNDPEKYDYSGQDPRMIQSTTPRTERQVKEGELRDWDTKKQDLQYACTFPLPTARDCSATSNSGNCDCFLADAQGSVADTPLCEPKAGAAGTFTQKHAKAYPTVREYALARKLGENGIAASLCPIQLDPKRSQEATYGYNPAVAVIVDRLKNALTAQCLPQKLTRDPEGNVPCLVLATLGDKGPQQGSCEAKNLEQPDPEVLAKFREQERERVGGGAAAEEVAQFPVCVVPQLAVGDGQSCGEQGAPVWCYLEGQPPCNTGTRPQQLLFSKGADNLKRVRYSLQCIQQFGSGVAAGDGARDGG